MTPTPTSNRPGPLDVAPVVPVVTIADPAHAVAVAEALRDGGIGIVELTLRTPAALKSLLRIAREVPDVVVGAGTVTTPVQVEAALAAGAQFLVSPGTSPGLLAELAAAPVPVLPGTATVCEAMAAVEAGLTDLKFFPAGPAGGPAHLAALAPVLPGVRFCPTGGVTPENCLDYLRLPNVAAVGGSWLTPSGLVEQERFDEIRALAAAAMAHVAGTAKG